MWHPSKTSLSTGLLCLSLVLGGCRDEVASRVPTPTTEARTPSAAEAGVDAVAQTANLASTSRQFRNWTALCDAANHCTAYTPAPDNMGFILVRLAAGPEARADLMIAGFNLEGIGQPLSARIDGQTLQGVSQRLEPMDNEVFTLRNPGVSALKALGQGRSLDLIQGGQSVRFSLSGLAAAFLWIDERQGRLDTTTALIRRGSKPASSVPPAPNLTAPVPAPAISQDKLPPARLGTALAALPAVRACQAEGGEHTPMSVEVARLSQDRLLWSVPCGSGAYNFSAAYFVTAPDGSAPRQLRFQTSDGADETLVNASYDPATRTMSAFNKGRGIGDCGSNGEWVWTGHDFALTAESHMGECFGLPWDLWPMTWRTSNR